MATSPELYSTSRVWEIHDVLTPKPPDLVTDGRFFVREGTMQMWSDKDKKQKPRHFFLFNDIMLVCKKEKSRKYWLRIHITLNSPTVSVEEQGREIRLYCRTRTFVLFPYSPQERQSWVEDIMASVKGTHDDKRRKHEAKKKKSKKGKKTKLEPLKPLPKKNTQPDVAVPFLPPPPGSSGSSQTRVANTRPAQAQQKPQQTQQVQQVQQAQPAAQPTGNLLDLGFDPFVPKQQAATQQYNQPLQFNQPQPVQYNQSPSLVASNPFAGFNQYGQPPQQQQFQGQPQGGQLNFTPFQGGMAPAQQAQPTQPTQPANPFDAFSAGAPKATATVGGTNDLLFF